MYIHSTIVYTDSRAKTMYDLVWTGPGFPMQTRGCESLVNIVGRIGLLRAPILFCPWAWLAPFHPSSWLKPSHRAVITVPVPC